MMEIKLNTAVQSQKVQSLSQSVPHQDHSVESPQQKAQAPELRAQHKLAKAMTLSNKEQRLQKLESLLKREDDIGARARELMLSSVNRFEHSDLRVGMEHLLQMKPDALEQALSAKSPFCAYIQGAVGESARDRLREALPLINEIEARLERPLNPSEATYAKNAVINGTSPELIKFALGVADEPPDAHRAIGLHPAWVDRRAMARFATGQNYDGIQSIVTSKAKTMLALNQASQSGLMQGQSLLYLGSGGDISHPLFATGARQMDFVTLKDHAEPNSVERHLKTLVGSGYEVLRTDLDPLHTRFTVRSIAGQEEAFRLNFHYQGYDAFLSQHAQARFDYVMDKDSWFKEWKQQQSDVVGTIAEHLAPAGKWIGGYSPDKPDGQGALSLIFSDDTAKIATHPEPNWSGYETLQVRTLNTDDVPGALKTLAKQLQAEKPPEDEHWVRIDKRMEPIIQKYLSKGKLDADNYAQLMDPKDFSNMTDLAELQPAEKHILRLAKQVHQLLAPEVNKSEAEVIKDIRAALVGSEI